MSIKLFGQSQILKKDELLTVVREGTAIGQNVVYKDGKPIKRNPITFCVRCNVQPLGSKELLLVPELDRFREQYYIYFENKSIVTETNIEIQANSLVLDNDRVIRLGVSFQVQGIENWGSYSRARIMRIDTGPNQTP